MRRSSVDQKQDRRTDTINGDAHRLTGGVDGCHEATAATTTTTETKGGVRRRVCPAGQPEDRPPPAGASGATKPSAGAGAEVKIMEGKGAGGGRACPAGQPKDRPPPAGASGATKPSAGAGAEVKIMEGKGAGGGRVCPAGQPEDRPPPAGASGATKPSAGAGAEVKIMEGKGAGQPKDRPPPERTASPAGTSGAATATSARAGAVAKKKPEALKVVSRRGYTGRAVIPAQKKEIVSVAKAMHQENFAAKVKELFDPEREATLQALKTGVYVGWRCPEFTWDCIRVGESCRCFCGHLLANHHSYTGQSVHVPCAKPGCGCRAFAFIPSRPEEVGEFWLRKRPGFEPKNWRAKCRCKHSHDAHVPRGSLSCKTKGCSCPRFESSFLCAACDRRWEQHETFFDTEKSRREAGLPVGEAYLPFAEIPKLRNAVLTGSEEDDTGYMALREGGLAALPPSQPAEDGVASGTKASGFRPVYD